MSQVINKSQIFGFDSSNSRSNQACSFRICYFKMSQLYVYILSHFNVCLHIIESGQIS